MEITTYRFSIGDGFFFLNPICFSVLYFVARAITTIIIVALMNVDRRHRKLRTEKTDWALMKVDRRHRKLRTEKTDWISKNFSK